MGVPGSPNHRLLFYEARDQSLNPAPPPPTPAAAKSLPAHYAVYLLLPVLLWAVLAYDVSALWTAQVAVSDTGTLLKHGAVLMGIELLVRRGGGEEGEGGGQGWNFGRFLVLLGFKRLYSLSGKYSPSTGGGAFRSLSNPKSLALRALDFVHSSTPNHPSANPRFLKGKPMA